MGSIQQCCFEDKKFRNNGFKRLKGRNTIDKTSNNLINHKKNKNNSLNKKEINKNNSDVNLTEIKTKTNKGIPKCKNKKEYINDIQNINTFNKRNKKKKNKSSSVEVSNPIIRKNTYDGSNKSSNSTNNNNINRKRKFVKGDKIIGEGRYGKIYSGYIISNGQLITIKTYNNLSDKQKNRIIKNLEILYKLEHKNIIKAISLSDGDVYDENGDFNIVFEYIGEENVEVLISKFGSLDEGIIQKYTKQLLEGLQYLHKQKIYHKNLKASNILVGTDATIKISDCFVDNLILGNAKEIYLNLLESNKVDYYIPPFFIQSIKEYKEKKNINNIENISDDDNIFEDWQSYDLWFLGCLIIEVASRKKPWSHYNFENNKDFFKFLGSTDLIPTIPKKLSKQCQELIKILLNYNMTKKPDIYDIIFNLDFFKLEPKDFTYDNIKSNINGINDINYNLSESQSHFIQNEDSSISFSNNMISESGTQLGQYLANNKVVNILNSNQNASFSVSYTIDDNSSLTQSYNMINKNSPSGNKLNPLNLSRGKMINNINKNKLNEMAVVPEAQIEQSPDPVKDEKEKFFRNTNQ